mmetsp:Transcript_1836/g.4862  ORF Transcript_1836/g.4862 Transcript_1836/m.4862 type:complete len:117 (+) Transcript_1836:418-768(+)
MRGAASVCNTGRVTMSAGKLERRKRELEHIEAVEGKAPKERERSSARENASESASKPGAPPSAPPPMLPIFALPLPVEVSRPDPALKDSAVASLAAGFHADLPRQRAEQELLHSLI